MANNNMETIGVRTAVERINEFVRDMGRYDKSVRKSSKETERFEKSSRRFGSGASDFASSMLGSIDVVDEFVGVITGGTPLVGTFTSSLVAMGGAAAGGVAAVAALTVGVGALGLRAADVNSVEFAFRNLVNPIFESQEATDEYIRQLREGAADTISTTDLLKQANDALSGTSRAVTEAFAKELPNILEIVRGASAATGRDVDFLFESVVTGIKRSSAQRLDNANIIITQAEANERYAESIGVAVEQLTAEQEQLAIINAVVEEGTKNLEAAGGASLSAADTLDQIRARVTNIIDVFSQPFEAPVTRVLAAISAQIAKIEPFARAAGEVLADIINVTLDFAALLGRVFGPVIQGQLGLLVNSFRTAFKNVLNLVTGSARRIVNIAAAIGNGLLAGANRFIFPAVIQIATFIADFLSGFSPAKRGPLSTIDKGAANIAKAWGQGFAGGFEIDPVKRVAAEVNMALGEIGELSARQVAQRFRQLDQEIQPFEDRVKILTAEFEALNEFSEAGFKAIDAEVNSLLPALNAGSEAAAERIRQLDAQKAALQDIVAEEEMRGANAKIQLALAKGAQAEERALLGIQKSRVGEVQKTTRALRDNVEAEKKAAKETKKGKPKGAGAGAGAGLGDEAALGEAITPADVEGPNTPISDFISSLGDDFQQGLGAGGELARFRANRATLEAQVGRIQNANPLKGIRKQFARIDQTIVQPTLDTLRKIPGFFTDPEQEGSLAALGAQLQEEGVAQFLGSISESMGTWASDNLITPIKNNVQVAADAIFGDKNPDSLRSKLAQLNQDAGAQLGNFRTGISSWLSNQFVIPIRDTVAKGVNWFTNAEQEGSLANFITRLTDDPIGTLGDMLTPITTFFTDNFVTPVNDLMFSLLHPEGEDSILSYFDMLLPRISIATGNVSDFVDDLFQPFATFFTGEGAEEGAITLPSLFDDAVAMFGNLPGRFETALGNFAQKIYNMLADPIIDGLNAIIEAINDTLRGLMGSNVVRSLANLAGRPLPEGADAVFIQPIKKPTLGGAETGGLFGAGSIITGESGPEIVTAAQPFAVLSNRFIRALDNFAAMQTQMASFTPTMGGSGMINNNQDQSVNVTMHGAGGMSAAEVANRIAIERSRL